MTESNQIRLTDKFIIERTEEEGQRTMTIDGHDLKEFTLELQSAFTTEVEAQLIKIQAQTEAISVDLYQHITTESAHYQELDTKIIELNSDVQRNRISIDGDKELIDELYETTRIIGRYNFLDKNTNDPDKLAPGEMGAKFVESSSDGSLKKFGNITEFYFHKYDMLHVNQFPIPADGGGGRTFQNIFVGDIIEISYANSISLLARGSYIVTSVELVGDYGLVVVEIVMGAGDGDGFPFSDDVFISDDPDQPDGPESWRDYRVEVFPSIPTTSFVDKSEYRSILSRAIPIGMVMPWFTDTLPEGWQKCDGSTIDSKYAEARTYLSRTPDLRGRALVGAGYYGIGSSPNVDIGQTTSKPSNTPTTTSAGSHTHTFTMSSAGQHSHKYGDNTKYGSGSTKNAYSAQSNGGNYTTSTSGSHTHTATLSTEGSHSHTISGWDSYNRMYSHSCHYIMKVAHVDNSVLQ